MKNDFGDIVPPEGRSIRKVSVNRSSRKRPSRERRAAESEERATHRKQPSRTRRGNHRFGLWVVVIISVLILVFAFSFVFSGAKVVVTPKQRVVLVDAEFQAAQTPALDEIGFEVMTIEREGSEEVSPSGEEYVEEKASGQIVIYNNYNSANQRLIKNTRFETPEGLIYRINESVVVPGQYTEDGVKVPGSIEVTVYADEPGENYNIGLTDFTIPGFEGSPRFEAFYARSKTEMTNGFVGDKKVISENEEASARAEIQSDLESQLREEAIAQKPEGFELYPDAIFISFTPLSDAERGSKVAIREKATLYGVLFKQNDFARLVALNTVAGFDEEPIEIVDPQSLSFAILNKEDQRPWDTDAFRFTLEGNAHLVWTFDAEQLREDLAGKSKGALETVLSGYPSIDEAKIALRPFWRQTFPEDVTDIKVVKIIEE